MMFVEWGYPIAITEQPAHRPRTPRSRTPRPRTPPPAYHTVVAQSPPPTSSPQVDTTDQASEDHHLTVHPLTIRKPERPALKKSALERLRDVLRGKVMSSSLACTDVELGRTSLNADGQHKDKESANVKRFLFKLGRKPPSSNETSASADSNAEQGPPSTGPRLINTSSRAEKSKKRQNFCLKLLVVILIVLLLSLLCDSIEGHDKD